ncbi:unnamed protein product, partial [Pleuronectes platessa]
VGKAWPQSGVRVEGGTLQFLTRSSDLNGLYQCTAFNPYGRGIVYIYRSVISEPCVVCWILFALLIVLIVAAATQNKREHDTDLCYTHVRPMNWCNSSGASVKGIVEPKL